MAREMDGFILSWESLEIPYRKFYPVEVPDASSKARNIYDYEYCWKMEKRPK